MIIEHQKNTAFELAFPMIDASSPESFKAGETVTDAAYYKDGAGSWTSLSIADTAAEIGSTGMYQISLIASELNHDWVVIKFTATNSADTMIIFRMDGNIPANVEAIESGAITAAAIATDAVDADALKADAVNAIRDAILADSTPFDGASIAAILADTDELQTDDVPGLIAALNNFDPASDKVYLADGAHGGSAAVLTLERVVVASTTAGEPGIKLTGNTTGAGLRADGGASAPGVLIASGGTQKSGLELYGDSYGAGIRSEGGIDGCGIECVGGAVSGHGFYAYAQTDGAGITAIGTGGGYDINADIHGGLSGAVGSLAVQAKADVKAECGAALGDYDPPTKAEMDTAESNIRGADSDTLKTISDEIAGLNDLSAAEVNAEVDTALGDYDPPTKAELDAGFAGLNDLSAAQVNAEVDTALADYDPPTKAEMDAGLAGLNDLSAAEVNAQCDAAIETYHLDHLIGVADPGGIVDDDSLLAKLAAASTWAGYVRGTDSLQAIRDRGDAAWGAAGSETTLHEGTAQAGGASTITLENTAVATADYYNNTIIALTGGTGAGQAAIIEDYSAARVATVSLPWATQPDNTTEYKIFPFGSVPGASAPTAGQVADAVLDEMTADHQVDGSVGEELHLCKAVLGNKRVMDTVTRAIEYRDDDGTTPLLTLTPTKTGPHELTVTPS